MAQEIYDTTLGFRQKNDPNCKKIRSGIQAPLRPPSRATRPQQQFEQAEMASGGNIHQLILELVEER